MSAPDPHAFMQVNPPVRRAWAPPMPVLNWWPRLSPNNAHLGLFIIPRGRGWRWSVHLSAHAQWRPEWRSLVLTFRLGLVGGRAYQFRVEV